MVKNMSFSYSVKEEIAQSITDKLKSRAALYGMILFCKALSQTQITLQTENYVVATLFKRLIGQLLKNENAVTEIVTKKKNNTSLFSLKIEKPSYRKAIFNYFDLKLTSETCLIDKTQVGKAKNLSYLVAGAFLVCGSITDPLKEYHLEFVIPSLQLCEDLMNLLLEFGIQAKQTERNNSHILYIKESENIEDILTLMGAPKCSLEIMNVKILKDVRNKINRAVNCDSANIEKTLKAAEKQIDDIELISKKLGLSELSDDLRQIAELRLENPDWNLKELGENLNPPISRSGANHRLARIAKIAQEFRKEN